MPQQNAVAAERHAGRRLLGPLAEAFVAAHKFVAAPFAGEDALGRAVLDAGPGVEFPPAGERPRHDLDAMVAGAGDLAIARDRLLGGAHQRHIDQTQSRGNLGIETVEVDLIHQAARLRSSPASARSISFTTLSRP